MLDLNKLSYETRKELQEAELKYNSAIAKAEAEIAQAEAEQAKADERWEKMEFFMDAVRKLGADEVKSILADCGASKSQIDRLMKGEGSINALIIDELKAEMGQ